ncbi:MAG: DUF3575 domain-containing protein [Parabacteroides sp.]|nr:DUF3575 domain-containing protein [Parabacteroides sp.]
MLFLFQSVVAQDKNGEVTQTGENARPYYMALKTNLLYTAVAIPNIGLEFTFGKDWTVGANWMYAWWHNDHKYRYWRTYGGDLYVRKWLGKRHKEQVLSGHHIGLYGQALTYDFAWGGRGYMSNKWNYAGGVEYGYSLPIAKRLNLDFTIGVGYMGGLYKEYEPQDNHYVWQITKKRHWWGPTKAEVSLVWILDSSMWKKGGHQ